jgi:hypothetical protein
MNSPSRSTPHQRQIVRPAEVLVLALGILAGPVVFAEALPPARSTGPAEVVSTEGTVHVVKGATGKRVIISPGSGLGQGDVVNTGRDSTVRLRFTDGGELAVRPNSSVSVDDYKFSKDAPAEDNMVLRLIKGGIRQLTGLIGKRGNRDAYRLNTVTATIGIRGTDFTARLCEADCKAEGRAKPAQTAAVDKPINNNPRAVPARVHSTFGAVVAVDDLGMERKLAVGAPVYAGERVRTDAAGPAALVFSDQTRVVIDRKSEFKLDAYRYAPDRPQADNFAVSLVKGGVRFLTGLLGKRSQDKIVVRTVTATIGVRGTNFDLVCAPAGLSDPGDPPPGSLDGAPCDDAVYAHTRDGAISLKVGARDEVLLKRGEAALAPARDAAPLRLAEAPVAVRDRNWPAPEGLNVDMNKLFGPEGADAGDPGLFVMVRDGAIAVTSTKGETAEFAAGESGRISLDNGAITRFSSTPRFMERDPTLSDRVIGYGVCRP